MIRVSMGCRALAPALLIALLVPGLTAQAQTQPPFQVSPPPPPDQRDDQDKKCEEFWTAVEKEKDGWHPLKTKVTIDNKDLSTEEKAECFFRQTGWSMLQQTRMAALNDRVSFASEFIGVVQESVRLSVGGVVANVNEEDEPEANEDLESFFAGGGNLYMHASYPLYDHKPRGVPRFTLFALPRGACTFPALGSEIEDPTCNLDIAVEPHYWLLRPGKPFQIFLQMRAGYVLGTDKFYEGIGLEDHGGFAFGQGVIGVLLDNHYAFTFNFPLFAPDELDDALSSKISMMFVPKLGKEEPPPPQ